MYKRWKQSCSTHHRKSCILTHFTSNKEDNLQDTEEIIISETENMVYYGSTSASQKQLKPSFQWPWPQTSRNSQKQKEKNILWLDLFPEAIKWPWPQISKSRSRGIGLNFPERLNPWPSSLALKKHNELIHISPSIHSVYTYHEYYTPG